MNENEELNIGISDKEIEREVLKAVPVEVKEIKVDSPPLKDGKELKKKFVFICKHPDKEETIEISKVRYEKNSGLATSGTWVTTDEEGLLLKNCAAAILMQKNEANTPSEMVGKQIETVQDTNQFLVFKAY